MHGSVKLLSVSSGNYRSCSSCLLSNTCSVLFSSPSAVESKRKNVFREVGTRNVYFMRDVLQGSGLQRTGAMSNWQSPDWIVSFCVCSAVEGSRPEEPIDRCGVLHSRPSRLLQQRRVRAVLTVHTWVNTRHTPCANWNAATHRCGFKLAFSFQPSTSSSSRVWHRTDRATSDGENTTGLIDKQEAELYATINKPINQFQYLIMYFNTSAVLHTCI